MFMSEMLNKIQNRILNESTYWGIKTLKSPVDFWIYSEILFKIKPDLLIEIGNFHGGSALSYAHIFDILNNGLVLAIDIDHSNIATEVRRHERIHLIESDAKLCVEQVSKYVNDNMKVLVIEDSSHEYDNTLKLLREYSKFVSKNSYYIVEDTICHHGLDVGPKPGPFEAVESFLQNNNEFLIDKSCENFGITWNPNGYLKKMN